MGIYSVTRRNITASAVAEVCGLSPRALRYTPLDALGNPERKGGRWRRFSVIDCVRLAVIARLQGLGIGLAASIDIVQTAVDVRLLAFVMVGIDTPPSFMLQRLDGLVLHLIPRPDGHELFTSCETVPPIRGAVALVINVGVIAAETVKRLEASFCRGPRLGADGTRRPGRAPVSRATLSNHRAGLPGQESNS